VTLRRPLWIAGLVALACIGVPFAVDAQTDSVDTEHLFGFSEGSDIGHRGNKELEVETIGRFGRNADSYSAISSNFEFKYGLTENFRISAAAAVSRFDISGLAGTDDQHRFVFDRFSSEVRFRVLDRTTQSIGLTLIATPFFGFVDNSTGAPSDRFGASIIAAADSALVANRVYGAFNLGYAFERDRAYSTNLLSDSSILSFNAAFSARLRPWLWLGGEVRYLRSYDGMAANTFAGQALYFGPVFYMPVAKGFSISGAWDIQAWGQASDGGNLDLTNFERHQVKFRLSIEL